MGGTHAYALLGADTSHGNPIPPQDAHANHGVNRPAADTSGRVGAMRGPTLRRGHPAWMRLTITEPSRGALTGRRSELNRTGRWCPPPNSKAGAPQIKSINQFLLQVCSGFPSRTYPPNTFGPETRAQRVRVHASPNAGRFWCGFVRARALPIATSPCGPRRTGLGRGDPLAAAALGPRRPRWTSPPPPATAPCRPHHLAALPALDAAGEGEAPGLAAAAAQHLLYRLWTVLSKMLSER